MSTLSVINIQGQSAATLPVFQDSTGVEYGRLCRAFVNFNGTGTISTNQSIFSSFNVSSVYKNATGNYTVNLINSPDANYAPVVAMQSPAAVNVYIYINNYLSGSSVATISQTQYSYRVWANNADCAQVATAVFR